MMSGLAVIPSWAMRAAITPLRQALAAAIAPAMLPWLADRPQAKLAAMPNAILVLARSSRRSLAQAAAAPIEPYQLWWFSRLCMSLKSAWSASLPSTSSPMM